MGLCERLGLDPGREQAVFLVGSGGKTTLLYLLAREAAARGLRVAVTTTTHIQPPDAPDLEVISNGDFPAFQKAMGAGRIAVAGTPVRDGRLSLPDGATLGWLQAHAGLLVVEADGSRRLPVKYPNATEPVLLPGGGPVAAVAGLSALGRPLRDCCHRWELACRALGVRPEAPVTPGMLAGLLLAGYRRYAPAAVVLNQADLPGARAGGEQAAALLRQGGVARVLVTSLKQEESPC